MLEHSQLANRLFLKIAEEHASKEQLQQLQQLQRAKGGPSQYPNYEAMDEIAVEILFPMLQDAIIQYQLDPEHNR